MSDGHDRFQCPGCQKRFRWKREIGGRKVRCTACNLKMLIPTAAGKVAEPLEALPKPATAAADEGYELSGADKPPAGAASVHAASGKCPSCNTAVKPGAVICINCGFNLQAGTRMQTRVEAEGDAPAPRPGPGGHGSTGAALPASSAAAALAGSRSGIAAALENREDDRGITFSDRGLPLVFYAVGIVSIFGGGIWLTGNLLGGLVTGTVILGVELGIMLPLLLIAAFLSAKLQGITFGYFGQALLKLSSICIGPGVWGDILAMIVMPFIPGFFSSFAVLFLIYSIFLGIPLSNMFDHDASETFVTIGIIIAVRLGAVLLLVTTLFTALM